MSGKKIISSIDAKNDKILITGSTGLLGSALVKNLRDKKFKKLILINSKKINLTNLNSIKRLLHKTKTKIYFSLCE